MLAIISAPDGQVALPPDDPSVTEHAGVVDVEGARPSYVSNVGPVIEGHEDPAAVWQRR